MFNHITNKENYIFFDDDNYLTSYTEETKHTIPDNLWFLIANKIEVYVNGNIEVVGGRFVRPNINVNENKHIGEFIDGSATIEFQHIEDDPLLKFKGVLSNGKIINYESSKTFREGYGGLSTGSDFDTYDKAPIVNKWLARSWIQDGEEELLFLLEDRAMLDNVAAHYSLPVPYDNDLKLLLDSDFKNIRVKSLDLDGKGPGGFVAVVVAGVVFEDNVATKLRLYKTSRWNE